MLELFRKSVEINVASVVITDVDAKIVYVNGAFTENTGYTLDEVKGENPNILKGDHADDMIDYDDLWKTLIAGNEWNGEFYNKDKYGEHFWEFARIAPVKVDGEIYYVAVKQNISRLKLLEDKLAYLYNKAETLPPNGAH